MRRAFLALACICAAAPAAADVVSSAPDAVSVTIYRDPERAGSISADPNDGSLGGGIALVSETRTVTLPAGVSKVVFRGVADAIVPQTARVDGWPAIILESNFDYALLTPATLIWRAHGERVQLVRTDRATGRTISRDAIIRSGPKGIVLETEQGMEALDCSGLDEKLVFPRVPSGLADEPTLSMTVRAAAAGSHRIRISYLALGLDWSANYVANINPDGRTLNLTGWLTLINHASTTFANAPIEVVAGDLARDQEQTRQAAASMVHSQPACWPIGSFIARPAPAADTIQYYAAPPHVEEVVMMAQRRSAASATFDAVQSELGDYKLYTLAEATTVAARQSKQVRFLDQRGVSFERVYAFQMSKEVLDSSQDQDLQTIRHQPTVTLRLRNRKNDGLGKPLPAGGVSVMEPVAGGRTALAGEDDIDDVPVGLPLELETGMAMDVWLEPRVVSEEVQRDDDSGLEYRVRVEVRFGNDKPVPVQLELRQRGAGEGFGIIAESHRHTLKSGDPRWSFKLQPGERGSMHYEFTHRGWW